MADPSHTERGPHDEAEELLPWYATGQLDADDRAHVERHLYACASCRRQLAVERRLVEEFQSTSPQLESGWARIRARVDPPRPAQKPRPTAAEIWALLNRPAVAVLAVAQLVFVVIAGSLLLSLSRPDYRALGSSPEPASANLIVIFESKATADDVRDSLVSAHASIVGGPTAAGAYLLHVDPSRRKDGLSKLRADGHVQLAEPIDGGQP